MKTAKALPTQASYSQVSTFDRCHYKYWLSYKAGIQPLTTGLGLMRGKYLHEAYDRYMFTGRTDHAVARNEVLRLAQLDVNEGMDSAAVDQAVTESLVVLETYLPWADQNDTWDLYLPNKGQPKCETSDVVTIDVDGKAQSFIYKIDAHVMVDEAHLMLENKFRKTMDGSGLEHDLQILLYQTAWNLQHPEDPITGVIYNIVGAKPRKKDGQIALRQVFYRGPTEERVGLRLLQAKLRNMALINGRGAWDMDIRKECSWDCAFVGLCLGVRAGATAQEYVDSGAYKITPHAERYHVKATAK